jgi:hypothetical protein
MVAAPMKLDILSANDITEDKMLRTELLQAFS